MQYVAHIQLPVPTRSLQLYLRNKELLPGKKNMIATISARDTSGNAIEPHMISWTFSDATNSPYCYVPPMERHGAHFLKPLAFDIPVAELTVRLSPWGTADPNTPSVIASIHYACSPSRSANFTDPSLAVAGIAHMEVAA